MALEGKGQQVIVTGYFLCSVKSLELSLGLCYYSTGLNRPWRINGGLHYWVLMLTGDQLILNVYKIENE